jgi:hypothetical protein
MTEKTGRKFPITLSLSKRASVPHAKGFDRLSPNGSLRTLKFACGPKAEARFHSSPVARSAMEPST